MIITGRVDETYIFSYQLEEWPYTYTVITPECMFRFGSIPMNIILNKECYGKYNR